ncbi:MAG: hypothetical protein IIC21_08120 [Chloroflexi bacterium]|nr:hypothetical protein [Chloroflexota bacterium]
MAETSQHPHSSDQTGPASTSGEPGRSPAFAHPSEEEFSKILDFYGLRWEYEPEGVVLEDGTWYLPDFWLPDMHKWVEVKPNGEISNDAWKKAQGLADVTERQVFLLNGAPWPMWYPVIDHLSMDWFCWVPKYTGDQLVTTHDGSPAVGAAKLRFLEAEEANRH